MSQIKTKFIEDLAVSNAKVATGIDAAKLADGSVSNTELQYINSLTSNAQTQLGGKASTTLNNLGTTAINAELLFDADDTYNLASAGVNLSDVNAKRLVSSTNLRLTSGGQINVSGTSNIMNLEPDGGNQLKLRFLDGTGSFHAEIKAPVSLSASYSLTLPPDDGTSGQVLRTDGAGVTTWVTVAAESRAKETFTLSAGDITAQLITLANTPLANSVHFIVKGGAPTLEGASHDYTVSTNTIVFQNDLATGGAAALIAGDVVQVVYEY